MTKKKCKGINKAKGFDGCGALSEKRRFGLCPLCLYKSGKAWHDKQFIPKVRQRTKKRTRENARKQRNELKSVQRLIQEARRPFQKWIRKRDENEPCISCGTTNSDLWDAGHYFKAELYSGLIFQEINVNKQCRKCNRYLDGNEANYRIGLVKKYGAEVVRQFEKNANQFRKYKYSKAELIEIKSGIQIN